MERTRAPLRAERNISDAAAINSAWSRSRHWE